MKKSIREIMDWQKVIWLNFGSENKYNEHSSFPWIEKTAVNDGNGLDQICLMMGQENDHVYIRRDVPDFVLAGYVRAGFELPHIHILNNDDRSIYTTDLIAEEYQMQIKSLNRYKLMPFGITQIEEDFAEKVGMTYFGISAKSAEYLNNKIQIRKYLETNRIANPFGCIAENYRDADRFINRYISQFPLIIKTEYGSSGTGIFIVRTVNEWNFVYKRFKKLPYEIPLLIERYYKRKHSFNYQLLAVNNQVRLISIKKQQVNRSLSYVGCDWPDKTAILKKEDLQDAVDVMQSLLLQHSGNALINIDGIMDDQDNLYPVIDLNARFSLTSYFTLSKRIQYSSYQFFRFRYYTYQSGDIKLFESITSRYQFGKCDKAVVICCCQIPSRSLIGRIGVLYAANYLETLDILEQKFIALMG